VELLLASRDLGLGVQHHHQILALGRLDHDVLTLHAADGAERLVRVSLMGERGDGQQQNGREYECSDAVENHRFLLTYFPPRNSCSAISCRISSGERGFSSCMRVSCSGVRRDSSRMKCTSCQLLSSPAA